MKTHLRTLMIALVAFIGAMSNAWAQTAPTITTTLPATAKAHTLVPFTVNITKGDANATDTNIEVVLKLTGDNAATQATQVELKAADNTLIPLTGTETVIYSAATFPDNLSLNYTAMFKAVGTFEYTLELRDADATTNPVLASVNQTTVVTFLEPTINTTLDDISEQDVIATGADVLFRVFLDEKDRAGETVTTRLVLSNPADRSKFTLQAATNEAETEFETLTIGEDGILVFGPAEGFPLATTDQLFKVNFSEAGTYSYAVQVLKGEDILGFSNETVTVVAGDAAISSTLDGKTIRKDIAHNFAVSIDNGQWTADTKYRVRFTLDNPEQRNTLSIATAETTPVTLTFNENGVAYFGDEAGFAVADNLTLDFTALATAYGTYGYTLELLRVVANQDPQVVASSEESVTVAFINATIASNLNNRTGVKTTVPQNATVTVVANDNAGDVVRAKLTLSNAAQKENITLAYQTGVDTYESLTFDENGVVYFGPAEGYPLADATTSIRVTFDEAGTYAYTLSLVTVGETETVVASSTESVTVAAFQNATVATTMDARANVKTTIAEEFTITATAGDVDPTTMVLGRLTLTTPAQADDITLEYFDTDNTYKPIAIGTDGVVTIGPVGGMMLSQIDGLKFRATFDAAATYGYKVELFRVSDNTVLATSNESVVVAEFVNATVATTLNGTEVNKDAATPFTVTATANDANPATMVRGRLTLANAAQATNIVLEYRDAEGAYQPIAFDNGVALIGPTAGMALSDINALGFRATFNAAGTYAYTLDLVNVDGGAVVATASESVEAIAATGITKGFERGGFAVYPTLTTGAVKVDLVNARNASIQVIDMMGRAVMARSNANGTVELDLSKVAKGTYIVRIQDGSNVNTQRVIVR